ncbi:NtaA/DmoA family FMN-dependent monooxygenase [Rhodococcoides kyotonense]|uniref:FMN-dependent oxidoreductase, nitrilotriacetate monooxygenase family n=1 Tax=Rhodococcoides kyotonense TaxID=398843 RepID=A0A239ILF6_9NOCA|nr:NtaA/DmoA family FMN-dependent monooxygenase [Rhodococcus kyotonensis]SNS94500.1 FMN-dependent oxidoreductase, nitrilotriacetate monooxygenase family [Rhodococcus kyotonensis]
MARRNPSVFFVSSEFYFADRFPRWKQDGYTSDTAEQRRAKAAFARELEDIGFDAIFIADFAGLNRTQIKYRGARSFEPLTHAAYLAAHTDRIGLVITLSTQFSEPYTVARELTSLDRISDGRAGWNVVTSFNGETNYGYETIPSPEDRYRRAREFLNVTRALWHSWKPNAVVRDREVEVHVDIDKVVDIDWHGEFFSVQQALDLPPAPQTFPVLAQAGASDIGIAFAAKAAEVVFVATPDIDAGRSYYKQLKAAVVANGRRAEDLKVLPGIRIYLGHTDEHAWQEYRNELTDLDLDRAREAIRYEVPDLDLSDLGLDDRIPPSRFPTQADIEKTGRRVSRALIYREWVTSGEYATVRDFLLRYATSYGHFQIVGTAEYAARIIETWIEEEASDGFILLGGSSFERISRDLVPLLRERGIFREEGDETFTTLRDRLGTSTPGLA